MKYTSSLSAERWPRASGCFQVDSPVTLLCQNPFSADCGATGGGK